MKEDTIMKNLSMMTFKSLSMAVLLMAGMTLTACSSDDNEMASQPEAPKAQTFTLTVEAQKGGTTRTLTPNNDNTLTATWSEGDEVKVYKGTEVVGTLTAQTTGETTTLSGTLMGTFAANNVLVLEYLSPSYDQQDGTLTGTNRSIDKVCDYATAEVTVTGVSGNTVIVDDYATFKSQQAIAKITLTAGNVLLNPSEVSVTVSSTSDIFQEYLPVTYTLSDITSTTYEKNGGDGILYLAIPGTIAELIASYPSKNQTIIMNNIILDIIANVNDKIYFLSKSGFLFENGKFYRINAKLTQKALSNATSADLGRIVGQNGKLYATGAGATGDNTTPVGVIAHVGNDGCSEAVMHNGGHGLVLALKNALLDDSYTINWYDGTHSNDKSPSNMDYMASESDLFRSTEVSGYTATHKLLANSELYSAAKAARNHTPVAPEGTTGWFLPSAQQWVKLIMSLGGLSQNEIKWGDTGFDSNHKCITAWNKALANAGNGNYTVFQTTGNPNYWSSSEFWTSDNNDHYKAVALSVSGSQPCYFNCFQKVTHKFVVRPVFAF